MAEIKFKAEVGENCEFKHCKRPAVLILLEVDAALCQSCADKVSGTIVGSVNKIFKWLPKVVQIKRVQERDHE